MTNKADIPALEVLRADFLTHLSDGTHSWQESAQLLRRFEAECKKLTIGIDDFIIFFFEQQYRHHIPSYSNRTLLASAAMTLVWTRINRRNVFWHQGSEILAYRKAALSRLEVVLGRVSKYVESEEDGFFHAVMALIAFCKGDYMEGSRQCKHMCRKGFPEGAIHRGFFLGANTFEAGHPAHEVQDEIEESFFLDISSVQEYVKSNPEPVLIASCDAAYFDNFSTGFFQSARKHGWKGGIIFLVMGSAETYQIDRGTYFIGTTSTLTYEPALYASARYVLARKILREVNSSAFICDIDFLFSEQLTGLMREVAMNLDVGLCFHGYGVRSIAPWTATSAPMAFFQNNNFSHWFLKNYEAYFFEQWSRTEKRWWIDQNSLYNAYHQVRRCWPGAKIGNIFQLANIGCTNQNNMVQKVKAQIKNARA